MKKTTINLIIISLVYLGSACSKDFLERPPLDRVTADNYYKSYDELRSSTSALYNIVWFDYNERADTALVIYGRQYAFKVFQCRLLQVHREFTRC